MSTTDALLREIVRRLNGEFDLSEAAADLLGILLAATGCDRAFACRFIPDGGLQVLASSSPDPEVTAFAPLVGATNRDLAEQERLIGEHGRRVSEDLETSLPRAALQEARGNSAEAARRTGMERTKFGRLVQKHKIDPGDYKPA